MGYCLLDTDRFTSLENREREITSESSKAYSAAKVCVQPKSMEGCVDSVVDKRFDLHGRGGKVGREASLSWQPVEVAL